MAVEKGPKLDWGILANSDLSGIQFQAVKFHGTPGIDAVVAVAADTDIPLGVLQNNPKAGEEAEVVISGIVKWRVGASAIVRNDRVGIDAAGRATKRTIGTDTTKYVLGTALESGAAGQVISVAVSFAGAVTA